MMTEVTAVFFVLKCYNTTNSISLFLEKRLWLVSFVPHAAPR
jgi:hypothetical protein